MSHDLWSLKLKRIFLPSCRAPLSDMGAYLRKPVTDKTFECGEYTTGGRKFLYAATAMQGWRVAMEDAHAIIPHFDEDTSFFAVYDGHGGKEVAVYCAAKLGDIVKSTESYRKGDISQALKDAFMKCDEMIMKPETIQEMKEMMNTEVSAESVDAEVGEVEEEDTQEELSDLIEEAHMPLQSLLAKYGAANPSTDAEVGDDNEAPDVKSVLQMMANQAGIEIEFEDSESGSDSDENENGNEDDDELGDIDVTTSSGKDAAETNKDCEQVKVIEEEKATPQESHSVEATKFSLTSLLSSSTTTPISSPSEMISASLTETRQSLHQNSQDSKSPLTTTLLPNHRKALSSNFNGHNVEKSLHSNNREQFVKSSTGIILSTDTKSESRTTSAHSSDTTGSDKHDSNDDSTTTLNLSAVNPSSEVSQAQPTSERDGACVSDTDSSSTSTSRTKTVGLMDLLTTAVEDKDSPVVLDTCEDEWNAPQAVDEITFTRGSRKRPHPVDDMDDLTLSEYSAKRHEVMDEEGFHSGTTAVVCILKGDELTVANAGDSRCVVSSKGKALEMSFDHKPTDPPELERIAKAGGQVGIDGRVNGGLNLTRAIGDHFYKGNTSLPLAEQMITAMPDIETLRITEDEEFIFLACDGIWNSKSSQDVVDFINCRLSEKSVDGPPTADDLVAICKSLCDACLAPDTDNDGTGCDNMTCLLVLLQPT